MRARAIIMLGLAFVLGAVAVFMARNWLQQQVQPAVAAVEKPTIPLTTVIVARTKMVTGNKLGAEHIREVKWPLDSVPPGAFKTPDELVGGEEPRVVRRTIEAGIPILPGMVTGFGERATMSTLVAKEMRAITIRINDIAGVAGFVMPGDKVDILLTREGDSGTLITDILLQNVKILGIDQRASEEQDKPAVARAATLEVTPVQAQKLALAQRVGQLSLALRSVTDVAAASRQRITVSDLNVDEINRTPEPKVAAAAPSPTASATRVVRKLATKKKPRRVYDPLASVKIHRGLTPSIEKVPKEKSGTAAKAGRTAVQATSGPTDLRPENMREGSLEK